MNIPRSLSLSVAITSTVAGCQQSGARAGGEPGTPSASLALDESKLPPVIHFSVADLDESKNACTTFGGYVNGKYLAANLIPSDRSIWGPGALLAERSLAIRHQLAEQAATNGNGAGIERIVGDF